MSYSVSAKRIFNRERLTVKVWPLGREFLDDLNAELVAIQSDDVERITIADTLNMLLIRALMTHSDITEWSEKLAVLKLKNVTVEYKYIAPQGFTGSLVSGTFPSSMLEQLGDIAAQITLKRIEFGIKKRPATPANAIQQILVDCVLELGDGVDDPAGLKAFAEELLTNYNYDVYLANHF